MNLVDARRALADALDTVAGVKGYTKRPTTLKPGDGWAILPSLSLHEGLLWRPEFRVYVVLPDDEDDAAAWLDKHFDAIVLALRGPGFPETAELRVLQTSAGDVPVLSIPIMTDPPE